MRRFVMLVTSCVLACSDYRSGDGGAPSDAGDGGDGSGQPDGGSKDATSEFMPTPGQCQLPQFYSNACQPCANANCCMQQQQCAQDPDCNAFLLCILKCFRDFGCPAPSCETGCTGTYTAGYNKFNMSGGMDNCVYTKCGGSSCTSSCPP